MITRKQGQESAPARELDVETSVGMARVTLDAPAGRPAGLLVLGHGAGGGIDAPDLVAVTARALAVGLAVARVVQPYRVAGRRAPAPAKQLDAAWLDVVSWLRTVPAHRDMSVVVGGRSSGARVACRTAVATGAVGVLALAFPLHPPGRPLASRAPELLASGSPVLVVQGERDAFGRPEEFSGLADEGAGFVVAVVPGADHALAPKKQGSLQAAAAVAAGWALGMTTSGPLL